MYIHIIFMYIYNIRRCEVIITSLQALQEALRAALDAVDSFRKLGDRRMEVRRL